MLSIYSHTDPRALQSFTVAFMITIKKNQCIAVISQIVFIVPLKA